MCICQGLEKFPDGGGGKPPVKVKKIIIKEGGKISNSSICNIETALYTGSTLNVISQHSAN